MKHIRSTSHPVRTFGLWALGGAIAYLIVREMMTDAGRQAVGAAGPTTPSTMSPANMREVDRDNGDMEDQLDAAVDASFPASDPISMQFE
ncbi:MAG TPA: hypothetical protein VFO96_12750 [Gemmatimonadales bacterium]|jgi:hypothetical protein|nr:hypothetical protein [Gemmatimonadales bacterium]